MFRIILGTGILLICLLCWSTMNADAKVRGYWAFNSKNEVGKDSSPNRNDGELKGEGTAEWNAKGKVGGGLQLSNGWLEVPHDDSLNLKDQVTLMCWVKFSTPGDFAAGGGREQSLIWKYGPFETNKRFWTSYALRVWRPKSDFGSFGFDANMTKGRSAAVDKKFPEVADLEKTWYHIAAVADGTEVRVYTNGKETGKGPQRGEFQASDLPLTIGHDLRPILAHHAYVNGIMDEVVVADKALTEAEIKEAMALGEKGKSIEGFNPVFAVEPEDKLATQWGAIKAQK
ncbi:LamG domain-containing protein [Candidatus Poribacteria bacterium]|nr:LamG domain-containing protein [Candidatus Poribacteria bacterium]